MYPSIIKGVSSQLRVKSAFYFIFQLSANNATLWMAWLISILGVTILYTLISHQPVTSVRDSNIGEAGTL